MTTIDSRPAASSTRGFWPMRDLPVVGWLVAVLVVSLVHPFISAPRWLMIHLLVLGAAGHAILVWSRYFADTLLRIPATPRREQSARLALFNVGVLVVTMGVPSRIWPLTVAGAALVIAAVVWHVWALVGGLGPTRSRFASTLHFYLAAGSLLPVGAVLGVWLARDLSDPLDTRVRIAHVGVNLLGWIGLTVLGTLVTLWPTMLRTRIVEGAEVWSRRALPALLGGITLVLLASWTDRPWVVAVGLVTYLGGVAMLAVFFVLTARVKPPREFPTWSVGAGVAWLVGGLSWALVLIARTPSWHGISDALDAVTPYLAAGFIAQVLLGALSYLVPVVLGGGPAAVRAANRSLDAASALRVTLANLGLVVCALPVPSVVRVIASTLVLGALASFVPLLLRSVRLRHRGETALVEARPAGQHTGLAAVGLALMLGAVAIGGAVDPASLGGPPDSAAAGVAATGQTVRVRVEAADMRFTPDKIEVDAGDHLIITLVNTDDTDVHDLVLETGHDSGRLAPGESAVVDVGVVGRDVDGWCSVIGHKQMGMVMSIVARGGAAAPAASDPPAATADSAHSSHGESHSGSDAGPGPDARLIDPALPPAAQSRVHRVTFRVTEQEQEVAPGVRQTLWTYNGTAPGPTLRGRVGDRFVITLVNDGKIGHSVDFHAGVRAPDKVMRTIPPGESLVYRFTARRAGIWMYHCSSMPMSAHIANGLFGAVVIDPPDLPEVDHEFVMVQSEQFFGPEDGSGNAGEVDMDKLMAERPDKVSFNGYPNQYDHDPLVVSPGDRVRFWILDAGPNRASSFHVVGGQFDRVWTEGSWTLGSASAPARSTGAQVLPLLPAQGGFVELTLTERGDYPFVSHVMIDAERGAHGILRVR